MFFVVGLQRFYSVKACPKEMKCDVEVSCFGTFVLLSVFNLLSLSDDMLTPMSNIYELEMQVGSYAVRDIEEYKNFCDRPKDQRPQPDEVLKVKLFSFASFYSSYFSFLFSVTSCQLVLYSNVHSVFFTWK